MKIILIISLLILSGCATADAMQNCQKQAGDKPYEWADNFGIVGGLAADQTDDRQIWDKKVNRCFDKWRAVNP